MDILKKMLLPGAKSEAGSVWRILESRDLFPQLQLHLSHLLIGQMIEDNQQAGRRGQEQGGPARMRLQEGPGSAGRARHQASPRGGPCVHVAAAAAIRAHREVHEDHLRVELSWTFFFIFTVSRPHFLFYFLLSVWLKKTLIIYTFFIINDENWQ